MLAGREQRDRQAEFELIVKKRLPNVQVQIDYTVEFDRDKAEAQTFFSCKEGLGRRHPY